MKRSLFVCALLALALSRGVAQTATVQLSCRSLQMQSATFTSPLPGVGQVTAYFTTYNPARTPRFDVRGGVTYLSSELRPRSGQAGVYETDYVIVQGNTVTEYGSLTLNLATADSNGNTLPDILEIGQSAAITLTGTARSDQPAGLVYSVSGTWNRAAGQTTGNYAVRLALTSGGAGAVSLGGSMNIVATVPARSTATYVRTPNGVLTFTIAFPSATGALTTSTFSAPFSVTNENTLSIPAFSFVDSNGDRYQVQAATLARTGRTYSGNFRLIDGQPATSWADYLDWYIEITDPNDSDGDGIPNLSDSANVVPTITTQPVARNVAAGASTSFSVSAVGSTPLTYQWYLNDNPLSNATSATLSIANVGSLNTGTYHVVVKNAFGEVTSDRVALALAVGPPSILAQPQGITLPVGGTATLSANISGADVSYQWFLNDTPILSANTASYILSNVQRWMAGSYKLRASNTGGTVTTTAVAVIVGATVNGALVFTDDFNGTTLTTANWTAALPFTDSRTDVGNGSVTLRNRGRLLAKTSFPNAYVVTTRFRLVGSTFDQFAVFLRQGGSTQSGSFNSGVGAYFQIRAGDQGAAGINNIKIAQNNGDVTASYPLAMNTWYDATIEDDGSTIVIKINGVEVVRRQTSERTGNLIGVQNREGAGGGSSISAGSATEIDYFRVNQSGTSSGIPTEPAPRLANISTRGFVGTGAEAIVIGFVTTGGKPQRLLVRAAGPALGGFGVQDTLTDPRLTVFSGSRIVASNDNWRVEDGAIAQSVGAFAFPLGSLDAALNSSFAPGAYTIEVSGTGDGTGIGLVEAYDLDVTDQQVRLANISTRGRVTSSDPLIAGLVVSGSSPRRILIRGIGPALVPFGLTTALPDPILSVYDSSGKKVFENDDWNAQENASNIQATAAAAGAFALGNNSRDAAIVAYLPPGGYTFVVSGKNGTSGIALIEAYDLN